jgi:hypothetical protein
MSDAAEPSDSPEGLTRHAARAARCRAFIIGSLVNLIIAAGAVRAAAQQPGPQPIDSISPAEAEFLPRTNFQLAANWTTGGDPRFTWDSRFGGSADVLDYHFGRLGIVGDYEAVVGSERKNFDVNQGLYILEASTSGRYQTHEFSIVFHHVSRHLSDRPKARPTAWNVLEGRYLKNFDFSGTKVALVAGAGNVVTHVDVDYTWNLNVDVSVRHALRPRLDIYGRGLGETFGVDPAIRGRTEAVHGGRFEGGVRLGARGGALELFAGVEHRMDADLHDYLPITWGVMGFRLVTK